MTKQIALLAALLAALLQAQTAGAASATVAPSALARERQVDALFAGWKRPDTPGAEFIIGSISKQFTAFSRKDGAVAGGILHWDGQIVPARRTARPVPSAAELKRFEGEFYSDELQVLYSIAARDGDLVLSYPRGTVTLGFNGKGHYATGFGQLEYQCHAQDACSGFTMNDGRVRKLQFTRVELPAPGRNPEQPR